MMADEGILVCASEDVLEGGRGDNHANAELVSLKERYARGELTTSAYVEARNKLLGLL